jgi:hypothetical protein
MLSLSSHCYRDKLGQFLDGVLESALPEGGSRRHPRQCGVLNERHPHAPPPLFQRHPVPWQRHPHDHQGSFQRHPDCSGRHSRDRVGRVLKWRRETPAVGSVARYSLRPQGSARVPVPLTTGPNTIARAPLPVRAQRPGGGPLLPLRPFWPALASRWPRAPRRQRFEGLVGHAHSRMLGPVTSASLTKRRHGGH